MLTKLIIPILFASLLNGCANVSPQNIPAEIQKNNNMGQLVINAPVQFFYAKNSSAIDGSPVDGYLTVFENGIAVSHYGGRILGSKVFGFKNIEKISFTSGEVSEYYRPKFITINWTSEKQINQFGFKAGDATYAIRLSDEDFGKVKAFIKAKNISEFSMDLAKRVRTSYDAEMEQSGDPMAGWVYTPHK